MDGNSDHHHQNESSEKHSPENVDPNHSNNQLEEKVFGEEDHGDDHDDDEDVPAAIDEVTEATESTNEEEARRLAKEGKFAEAAEVWARLLAFR